MGTQQLLLLVLVAIALSITYFKSNQKETEINEVIDVLNHIGATAQG